MEQLPPEDKRVAELMGLLDGKLGGKLSQT